MRRAHWLAGGTLLPLFLLLTAADSYGQVVPPGAPVLPPGPGPVPAPVVGQAPAYLKVWVPAVDARLDVDGVQTRSVGNLRQFASPPLPAGKRYFYELRLSYKQNGKDVVREKRVTVEPGKESEVDFREEPKEEKKDEDAKKDEPKLEPRPEPKPEPKPEIKKTEKIEKKEPKVEKTDEPKKVGTGDREETIVVPYVPTPQEVVDEMLKLASVKQGDVVYDLGCGDGRIVATAVKKYKAKRGVGYDLNPERIRDAEKTAKEAGVQAQVQLHQGDVLKLTPKDLADADVVTLYLLPEVNKRLRPVLQKALKPGSRIVSHDFDMGDWKADKEVQVRDKEGSSHTVYLWTIPEKK